MDDIFYKRLLLISLTAMMTVFQSCSRVDFSTTQPSSFGTRSFASINPDAPNNCSFNNQIILHGSSIVTYAAANVAYGLSCLSEVRVCNDGVLSGSYTANTCNVASPDACVFNGQAVPHGFAVTAYQNSSVAYGSTCTSQSRSCSNGILSGSYNFANCSAASASNCTFNGQTVPHGQSVSAYQNSSVAYGQSCVSQSRTCSNGVLSGSYSFASCNVGQPSSCLFNGQTVPHGQSVSAYQNSSVTYGSTCTSQSRSCSNGVLSGSYSFASCNVGQPSSCLFNGQTVAHGNSIAAYENSSVAYGQSCVSQSRTCSNGSLSGSNTFASCNVGQPSSCLFNGQTIAHGQTVPAYTVSSVPFGSTCNSVNRTCNNGVLSGSAGFASCEVDQPSSCFLSGQTVAHGSSIIAYLQQSPAYGVSCSPQSRSCNNGTLNGSYMQSTCAEKVCDPNSYANCGAFANGTSTKQCNAQGSGYGSCIQSCDSGYYMSNGACVRDCTFNGQTVAHGSSVTAYQSASPHYGSSCQAEARTCNNGLLSGSNTSPTCTPKSCNPGSYESCGYLENGSHMRQCNAQGSGFGSCVQSCGGGYTLYQGGCWPTQCTPHTSRTCYFWTPYTVGDGGGYNLTGFTESCGPNAQWEDSYLRQSPMFSHCL